MICCQDFIGQRYHVDQPRTQIKRKGNSGDDLQRKLDNRQHHWMKVCVFEKSEKSCNEPSEHNTTGVTPPCRTQAAGSMRLRKSTSGGGGGQPPPPRAPTALPTAAAPSTVPAQLPHQMRMPRACAAQAPSTAWHEPPAQHPPARTFDVALGVVVILRTGWRYLR
jgi:hypothetical protein